jgi:hypothetical protein
MANKTVYLRAKTKILLISDIKKVFDNYNGEIEFSNETYHLHYIGQIAKNTNKDTGEVIDYHEGYHANLLVPIDFDESIFVSLVIAPPENPVHQFA